MRYNDASCGSGRTGRRRAARAPRPSRACSKLGPARLPPPPMPRRLLLLAFLVAGCGAEAPLPPPVASEPAEAPTTAAEVRRAMLAAYEDNVGAASGFVVRADGAAGRYTVRPDTTLPDRLAVEIVPNPVAPPGPSVQLLYSYVPNVPQIARGVEAAALTGPVQRGRAPGLRARHRRARGDAGRGRQRGRRRHALAPALRRRGDVRRAGDRPAVRGRRRVVRVAAGLRRLPRRRRAPPAPTPSARSRRGSTRPSRRTSGPRWRSRSGRLSARRRGARRGRCATGRWRRWSRSCGS